jgi:hypothetical protein
MTHSLHRCGDRDSLKTDFVMLIMTGNVVKKQGSGKVINDIWDLLTRYQPYLENFGNASLGNSHQYPIEAMKKARKGIIHAVFKDRQKLKACLTDLKDHDFGVSVVVSCLYEEVAEICSEIGLSPHTVEYSLQIHGKKEKLPDKNILEITTMCGHAMVSPHLVSNLIRKVKDGNLKIAEASTELSRMCVCGIFNPFRSEKILKKILTDES